VADQPTFVCDVCSEDFRLNGDRLGDPSWVLACPCCGSTDVLRVTWEDESARLTAA
jgi:hypothetical protein